MNTIKHGGGTDNGRVCVLSLVSVHFHFYVIDRNLSYLNKIIVFRRNTLKL